MSATPRKRLKRRLESLNKRADFLSERIELGAQEGKIFQYDKAELSAVVWAINFIEDNLDAALRSIAFEAPKEKTE